MTRPRRAPLIGAESFNGRPGPPQAARRPQTNGNAECFIRTMLGCWAYDAVKHQRRTPATLDRWLWRYNHRRGHLALGRQTPADRLNNLLGT